LTIYYNERRNKNKLKNRPIQDQFHQFDIFHLQGLFI
jgi:hypothetical protein